MTITEKNIKRVFDVFFACFGLFMLGWLILTMAIISKIHIKGTGFFKQKRIGLHGKLFTIYKIETINPDEAKKENPQITWLGIFLRKYKIDELPQLYNVLIGDMSVVGPRPDVQGFTDELTGENEIIKSVRPGITGPATIYYRNEEQLLKNQSHPNQYNLEVIWPKKVEINKTYVQQYTFAKDLYYIYKTLI